MTCNVFIFHKKGNSIFYNSSITADRLLLCYYTAETWWKMWKNLQYNEVPLSLCLVWLLAINLKKEQEPFLSNLWMCEIKTGVNWNHVQITHISVPNDPKGLCVFLLYFSVFIEVYVEVLSVAVFIVSFLRDEEPHNWQKCIMQRCNFPILAEKKPISHYSCSALL